MKNPHNDVPCLYFTTVNDTIEDVNAVFCQKTGFRREDLIGQKAVGIFPTSTRIFQQTHLFPLLQLQGLAEEIYIDLQTKTGGRLPVLINVEKKEINGNMVTTYAGIVVNNRKKFEDELVAAKKAAEKALNENTALLQAKQSLQASAEALDKQVAIVNKQYDEFRQFNRVVTHDLQEPLRKLFLFTNKLFQSNDESATLKTVQKIQAVSESMRSVVSGLQQYVWLTDTPVKKSCVNLQEQLTAIQKKLADENPDLVFSVVAENLPMITGDAEQMHFLLYELLSNAVRFRNIDGKLTVHITATESVRNRFATVPEKYLYDTYVKLQVRDNGTGFDPAFGSQVFELFKRLHQQSGLGVGLALCKKIVENHGGSISIHSTPKQGTTISILLPRQEQTPLPLPDDTPINTAKYAGNEG